jgi:TRAP transporter TAXI family solute receptor
MKRLLALTAGVAMALSVAAVGAQQAKQLSITTGGTGGVYYPLGGGFASIIGKNIPNTTAAAEVTGGSVANLQLVGTGKADMGLAQVDASWDAIQGQDKFKSGKLPIEALAVMYPNHMHVVTIDGTGITKIEDLKGKRVSTGSPGSATEVFAFRVIEAAGLDKDKDMKRERLGVAESVNAIKDKKIDAFFWVGGLPTAAVTDLGATPGTKIRFLEIAQLTPKMVAKYGNIYSATKIPKATYSGMDADANNVAVWNIMMVNASMSEDLAYQLTKLLFEKREELALTHKEALNLKTENQTKANAGVPFHKGALKYFAEKGIKVD